MTKAWRSGNTQVTTPRIFTGYPRCASSRFRRCTSAAVVSTGNAPALVLMVPIASRCASISSILLPSGTNRTPGTFCPSEVSALSQNPTARIRLFKSGVEGNEEPSAISTRIRSAPALSSSFTPSGCSLTNVTFPSTSAHWLSSPSRNVWPMTIWRGLGNSARPITSSRNDGSPTNNSLPSSDVV